MEARELVKIGSREEQGVYCGTHSLLLLASEGAWSKIDAVPLVSAHVSSLVPTLDFWGSSRRGTTTGLGSSVEFAGLTRIMITMTHIVVYPPSEVPSSRCIQRFSSDSGASEVALVEHFCGFRSERYSDLRMLLSGK